jgi:hypothetical protein
MNNDELLKRIERETRHLIGDQAIQIIVLRAALELQHPHEQPKPPPQPQPIPPQPEDTPPERKEPDPKPMQHTNGRQH